MSKIPTVLTKLVPYTDLYSAGAGLKVGGRTKTSSYYGILLSLATATFLFVFFIIIFIALANNRNPSFFRSERPGATTNESIYVFNPDASFQMGFGLVNAYSGAPYVDNRFYEIQARLEQWDGTQWIGYPLILEDCQATHFGDGVDPALYAGFKCFQPGQDNLYIRSYYDTSIYIDFVANCNINDQFCARTLSNTLWTALYTVWSVDPMNYENPISGVYDYIRAGILASNQLQRYISMPLDFISFSSDNGWLFSSNKTETTVALGRVDYDFSSYENADIFLRAKVFNSEKQVSYTREYKKIQDIFAQVNGLAGWLIPLIALFIIPFSTFKMYERAINRIYRTQRSDEEERNGGHHLSSISLIKSINNFINAKRSGARSQAQGQGQAIGSKNDEENALKAQQPQESQPKANFQQSEVIVSAQLAQNNQQNPQEYPIEMKEINIKQRPQESNPQIQQNGLRQNQDENDYQLLRPHGVSLLRWLKSFFKPDPEVKLIKQGIQEIEGTIDIVTIIQKFIEIDQLKALLLTEDQQSLFNDLEKPTLYIREKAAGEDTQEIEEGPFVRWEAAVGQKRRDSKEAYQNLIQKEELTEVDKQLLMNYEKKIKRSGPVTEKVKVN